MKEASSKQSEDGPGRAERVRMKAQAEGRDWAVQIDPIGEA